MATGRNEPCPCGSGQKYKSCCIHKNRGTSRGLIYLMVAIACIAAVGVTASFVTRRNEQRAAIPASSAQASRPTTPQPQPPGPVPPGKVWSAEHGHWHDINAGAGAQPTKDNPITMTPRPRRNVPQPPGPVPAGKVWSPEHGHWHTKKK